MLCSLTPVPLHWSQHIRSYPSLHVGEEEGGYLVSICRTNPSCKLRLKSGLFLRDVELQFSIIRGKLSHEVRQRDGLSSEAIGGLWANEQITVEIHGWIYLAPANFSALWGLVTAGGYERCAIDLMAEGADDDQGLWTDDVLSIISADIIFGRGRVPDNTLNSRRRL
jgi:hypothetical protein